MLGFSLGKVIFENKKKALFVGALCSFPFALQAIGSISVSSSFGFLTFLFAILLFFTYLQERRLWQKRIVFSLGVMLCFGYALYALLFWFLVAVSFLLQNYWDNKYVRAGVYLFSILLFPLVDSILGFSHIPSTFSLITFLKQVIGQFGGWYFARPVSNGVISSANILFSHVSKSNYIENIFSSFRWPVVGLCIFVAGCMARALWHTIKKENNTVFQVLALLFLCIAGGYIVGWYILTGDRVFVRRLDSVFAFLILIFTLYGIFTFNIEQYSATFSLQKKYVYFLIALITFSFTATTIYATGPNVRVVSRDEYKASQYIFAQFLSNDTMPPCVLSDTWTLLALEGVSSGNIVGGGFPIDKNFGQTQRVRLYNEFLKNPDSRITPQIASVLPVATCFVAISRDEVDPRTEERIHNFLGDLVFKSGPVLVWKMELKKF